MKPEDIKAEVQEVMKDRGYSREKAIERVARVTGVPIEEVMEACEGLTEDPE